MKNLLLALLLLQVVPCFARNVSGIPANAIDKLLAKEPAKYVCQICPHVDDIYATEVYDKDGICPVCNMHLIELHEYSVTSALEIHRGSGNYFIAGGEGQHEKLINVFYHRPKNFDSNSKVLIVLPGAGRNAWSYRDSWVEASEKYNVLILSPAYNEENYGFGAYHLGGIVSGFIFNNEISMNHGRQTGKYHFKDDELLFQVNNKPETWLFNDFDRIFDSAIDALGGKQSSYDIFGHSAGGQILHRMAVFNPLTKADRIIASNSGSYTIPNNDHNLPFGLADSLITNDDLHHSFNARLTLLVGELDNEHETRGSSLHTPIVDLQGLGRLARSHYFYEKSKDKALSIDANFEWRRIVVQGVGHDYRKMGNAAAKFLYE